MKSISWKDLIAGLIFLISLVFILWLPERDKFNWLITAYTVSFLSYLLLVKSANKQIILVVFFAGVVSSFLFEPHLSNDYYRFLWDGEMITKGINPYDQIPDSLIQSQNFSANPYYAELHKGMGDLSARHYSCYPSINQVYFLLPALASNSIVVNLLVMRILILLTTILGLYFLNLILKELRLDSKRLWLLALNPLFIIETYGNVHFEAVMISFVLAGIYLLMRSKDLLAGFYFSMAIQVKLLPFILLPFFLRKIGLKRSIIFYSATIIFTILLGLLFLRSDNYQLFMKSLALYFNAFEFNSFALYPLSELGKHWLELYDIQSYTSIFAQLTMISVAYMALYGLRKNWEDLLTKMMWGLFLYFMLTSTMHPWYLITLLSISVMTRYSFVVIWSFLVFLSYQFYSHLEYHDLNYRLLVGFEYLVVWLSVIYELSSGNKILSFLKFEDQRQPISFE